MKTVVLANQKGGVGKSAVLCQLAYYFALILNKRVLVIDLDHQRNTSKALKTGAICTVSPITAGTLLMTNNAQIGGGPFHLVAGDPELLAMERQAADHNNYATRLLTALMAVDSDYDVCLIDTNPNPDIRQVAALTASDYVLSPIQLNQEAIDGIGELIHNERTGIPKIQKVQAQVGKKTQLIGILPNMVEPTPFQRANFEALAKAAAKLLISMAPLKGYAAIKKTTAIAEAQAAGLPVWKLGKTSGRDAYKEIKPIFDKIAQTMELS